MAMASWMLKYRSGRFDRSRKTNDEDLVKLDLTKDDRINCKELLEGICTLSDISEAKRLNYLNAFVKFILHINGNISQTGFTMEEILCCLRVSLVNKFTQVRAGGLRAIRHILTSEDDIEILNNLQYPHLIARSFDIVLRNEIERIQALKLIRKMLLMSAMKFPVSLARCLVSLANGVTEDKDRMLRACLAALCELGILNSDLFIRCGGVAAITRNILDCQMPRIVECLCGVLLHLLHKPVTRSFAGVDLRCLAAPYCDFHYRHAWLDKNRDERELRFNCSRLALLSVLRSWPGILHFCCPSNTSGLQAIVDVLYLNQLEVRKAVLDLLYELLGLPQPEWTDEYSVALNAVDPSDPQDAWRIGKGFVAAEGRSIIPHLAHTIPNIAEIHLAILLYVFLECGLLNALVEVIVTSDTFISVRATILLGELLHLIHLLLPPECCDVTPALPNLLTYSTASKHQALAAVTALHQLHNLFKQRPASSSLYLDHILQSGTFIKTTTCERIKKRRSQSTKSKLYQLVLKDNADSILRESGVLQSKEGFSWNWNVIRAILKSDGDFKLKMDDSNHKAFLRRLVHYYQPSSNRYSHLDLSNPKQTYINTMVGCDLIHCLLATSEVEGTKLLLDWFTDIAGHIDAITTSKSAHDCLFSPQHMSNTLCQTYFLFIGHMCHSTKGIDLLQDIGIFKKLLNLGVTTNHCCYVKLIVSSFNYKMDGPHRHILSQILKCNQQSSRLYATQFLLVLLRAGIPRFEHWGIELLVNQLFDQSKAISLSALSTLNEACERKVFLEKLISLKPNLLPLGDKGLLLLIRFLSSPHGFKLLNQENFVAHEIVRWSENFNHRYVYLVEADILDSLTLHQRSEDGRYDRRVSSQRAGVRKDVYVLPHLFGQLVQHSNGFSLLVESGKLESIFQCVQKGYCNTEAEILELKSALWACGHIATSAQGVELLNTNGILVSVIKIAETCGVYSVRGSAVYVLGLMATTFKGANMLFKLGWMCVRHNRHERWPVIEEEDWSTEPSYLNYEMPRSESDRTSSDNIYWPDGEGHNEDFYLPDIDSTTDDEFSQFGPVIIQKKSSTLPYNSSAAAAQHKRSLSESKTADVLKKPSGYELLKSGGNEVVGHRHRDNSCTESTTSGVSSCDSVLGKSVINDRTQTLSPIPSSSSLSTLKAGLELRKQFSEGTRRVSVSIQSSSASNSLTISPADTVLSRFSHQDLLGYNTLRSLRRARLNSRSKSKEDPLLPFLNTKTILSSSGDRRTNSITRQLSDPLEMEDDSLENTLFGGPSSQSLSLTHKQPAKDAKDTGPCYMGICLPRIFMRLFPSDQVTNRRLSLIATRHPSDDKSDYELYEQDNSESTNYRKRLLRHEARSCLLCCRSRNKNIKTYLATRKPENFPLPESPVKEKFSCTIPEPISPDLEKRCKLELMKHVEQLANPVWAKQSKQALLLLKQKYPSLFQDICLYSEVSTMFSSMTYRLSTRRFLQELFFDLNFEEFFKEPTQLLSEKVFSDISSEPEPQAKRPVAGDVFAKQPRRNSNDGSTQRDTEIAHIMRTLDSVELVKASDTNRNITKGFTVNTQVDLHEKTIVHQHAIDIPDGIDGLTNKSALSPLASVKEETSESMALLDACPDNERSKHSNKNVPKQSYKLDNLKLTCSENKFPITTRNDSHVVRSSSFSRPSVKGMTNVAEPDNNRVSQSLIKYCELSLYANESQSSKLVNSSTAVTKSVPIPKPSKGDL